MTSKMSRIDTHCHVIPECWRKYLEELGYGKPDGMPGIPVSGIKLSCTM